MYNKNKVFLVFFKILIPLLLFLGFYSSITIGFSFDEYFHHINGLIRYKFLTSLGEFENFNFRNNKFYPGFYDTLVFTLINPITIINEKFYIKHLAELMHGINFIFSSLSLLGLYLIVKKIFDNEIAIYSVGLTLLNPFYFGHMGMNSKDIIIFFSLIWFCYFFLKYCTEENNHLSNLLFFSFFLGFGCGVRITFLIVALPAIIFGMIYLSYKFKSKLKYLFRKLMLHVPLSLSFVSLIIILCWPHILIEIKNKNLISFLQLIIENSVNWNQGPKIGLINGSFYEVFNTPKMYFLYIILYRLPIYSSILVVVTFVFFIIKNKYLSKFYNNFNQKFIFLILMLFFPILLTILLSVNIYDNLRLFLFVIPFYCVIAAIGIKIIIKFDLEKNFTKIFYTFILVLFVISFYRFIILTPYQYTYVNYTFTKLEKSNNKFEHDYWGTSYKELIKKIKKNYPESEIKKMKILRCGSLDKSLLYYLNRELGIKETFTLKDIRDATHIIMYNRTFLNHLIPELAGLVNEDGLFYMENIEKIMRTPKAKETCFNFFNNHDDNEINISRGGLKLSIFKKLN